MTLSPTLTLSDDMQIPQMGFGTWALGPHATEAVLHALRTGYRHLDTADIYGTHGNIAEAIPQSSIPRGEFFITTKLWSRSLSASEVGPSVDRFLRELRTDFIDLLLIHWPSRNVPVQETLSAMEAARQAGKARALGVSNFDVALMQEALASGIAVANNQIEYNLNHQPQDALDFCLANGVTVTAYSPLERGSRVQEAALAELAAKHSATREQVLLNWLMGKGMIVIPRSSKPAHIEANFSSLDLELEEGDAAKLDEAG
jgi:2,5-diketo-D-gluconate reductase B